MATFTPPTDDPCHDQFERPSGRQPGDRIVECILTRGHDGMHDSGQGARWIARTDLANDGLADWERELLERDAPKLQLVVTYFDHMIMYYPIGPAEPWKVDSAVRHIVIGRGVPRTYIPLDGVRSFSIEPIAPRVETP